MSGTTLRSDNAPSLNSLALESQNPDSIWAKYNIKWEMGSRYNHNKNPVVENKIKELSKEILKFKASGGPITTLDLVEITTILNSRVRHHGHASKEIFLRRDLLHNKPLDVVDDEISQTVENMRKAHHADQGKHLLKKGAKVIPEVKYKVGDLVLIRDKLSKHSPRDIHTVVEVKEKGQYAIKKLENQIRQRSFNVKHSQLISYLNYRPGPEQSADEESALEKTQDEECQDAKSENGDEDMPSKRQKISETSSSSLAFNLLNNNIINVEDSPESSKAGLSDLTIDSKSEHISAKRPAGKGAPVVSLRSKRSAAVLARKRWNELQHCLRVYTEYLHGWNYTENNEMDDDHFVYGWAKVPHNATTNDDLGINDPSSEMDELVAEYQDFLSDYSDQSESIDDSSQELIPDSMLPNHDLSNETINPDSDEFHDTTSLSPVLEVPPDLPLTTNLDQLQFNLGANTTSTTRTRAGRSVIKRDYKEVNSSGF